MSILKGKLSHGGDTVFIFITVIKNAPGAPMIM